MQQVLSGTHEISVEVAHTITELGSWVDRNGWAGYDPYDIKGYPLLIRLLALRDASFPVRAGRFAFLTAIENFPLLSRKLFRIEKEINPKAMGLFASAYMVLYHQLGSDLYLDRSRQCLEWLESSTSSGYSGDCWGYPFDWQSLVFIPRGTPSAVVSTICGDAFWTWFEITGESRYLDTCQRICDFLVNDLNVDTVSEDQICFSYTPIDRFHVHNANLFAAEFLIKVGMRSGRDEYTRQGIRALNYSLEAQNGDGSFYYSASGDRTAYNLPEQTEDSIDHYHTGFVLRSLHSIYKMTGEVRVFDALSDGYRYYRDNLFEDRMIPRMRPHSTYPINIHSCAEAILCMATLSDIFPDAMEYSENAFRWTKDHMQGRDGHFNYMRMRTGMERVIRMPYIRWGQAWMMRALAELLAVQQRGKGEKNETGVH